MLPLLRAPLAAEAPPRVGYKSSGVSRFRHTFLAAGNSLDPSIRINVRAPVVATDRRAATRR